ncbi:MAG: aldehyde ferredoxin oxidoreductase family protein [Anaerolineae bacterium]|nr:aldehyde ferredoxin oxidoreductase family protein [Anaerolineae bacterium]
MACYHNSILHVDLTNGKTWVEHPGDEFYRKYGGGSAMGMYYILKQTPKGVDPLSPENTLTMFAGVTTGLSISGQSRLAVNARSPLTGAIGDSQSGGYFPAHLKFTGFDGIVISGKAPKPVYLYLHDGKAEIRDASHLWGKVTGDVEDALKAELKDTTIQVLQIGPAGEKLVKFASIMNMRSRANGRTGMGAVMGSKLLKAVVVRPSKKVEPADPQKIAELHKTGTQNIKNNADVDGCGKYGTASVVAFQDSIGSLPTRNYNEGHFESFEELTGEKMADTILVKRDTCYACTVRCKRVVETEYKGQKVDPKYGGPEYETLATFGSYCGIADMNAVALANQICNMYGIDTISCGATIAFAMECFENGLITTADTGGIELKFGNADAMLAMLQKIAKREGFGDILAEGSAKAAAKIGKNASDFVVAVKGNELPAHMPQAKKSLAVLYMVNPFGADHQSGEHDPMYEEGGADYYYTRLAQIGLDKVQPAGAMNEEKVRFCYLGELYYSAMDTFCLCQFVHGPAWCLYGPDETVAMIKAATGWDFTLDEYMKVGERRLNMMRAYNAREGFNRQHDKLPKKLFKPLQGSGATAGVALNEQEMERYKDVYYQLAGWDVNTGNPTPAKLKELGLEWIEL